MILASFIISVSDKLLGPFRNEENELPAGSVFSVWFTVIFMN